MKKAAFLAFDTETTGLKTYKDNILALSAQLLDVDLSVIDKLTVYANPAEGIECDPDAARINGYSPTNWASKGAVSQEELVQQMSTLLVGQEQLIPIGHNTKFDIEFLYNTFKRGKAKDVLKRALSYHVIDTVGIAVFTDLTLLGKKSGSYKLEKLCARFGISLGSKAHDAEADIQATVELLKFLREAIKGGVAYPPGNEDESDKHLVKLSSDTNEWIFTRGKHATKSLATVYASDPDYLSWVNREVTDLPQAAKDALCLVRQAPTSSV